MTSSEIRKRYIEFFVKRGHKEIPSASLVPENDPTTLFTSSGMQPLVPYLLGQPHPLGKRLVNSQKSFRALDIDEVGDNRHTTFFEMLGNWSLGDYFKDEQLEYVWNFFTDQKEGLGLSKNKLFVSIFKGNKDIERDTISFDKWLELGVSKNHIYEYDTDKNWWSRSGEPEKMPPGEPGGPDSEVFYDFGEELKLHENSQWKNEKCHPNCQCGRFLEIGNNVFMQYVKQADGTLKELPNKNVDFGGGLERLTAATENTPDVFQTDLYRPLIDTICKELDVKYKNNTRSIRVIADHIKASIFLIGDGVMPSNKQQGYVLRRLLRRVETKVYLLNRAKSSSKFFRPLTKTVVDIYPEYFRGININNIEEIISLEIRKFRATIERGLHRFDVSIRDQENLGLAVFNLEQSYGFPKELTIELLKDKGITFTDTDMNQYEEGKKSHVELSRMVSAGMFKGGLQDHSEEVVKLHTATHLLHQSLRLVLGNHVSQKGSNITSERLRFDFSHPQKLTPEEIKKVEDLVNEQIQKDLPVKFETMSYEEAVKNGALAFFGERYPEKVKVYSVGSFSREICGGPHVEHTGTLGKFKIIKEEALGSGTRRVYAKLD